MQIISEDSFYTNETKIKWDRIVSKAGVSSIGQQYEYSTIWWKIYRNNIIKKKLLCVIDCDDENGMIWPLMIRNQYLQIGLHNIGQLDGFITDYAFPIIIKPNQFIGSLIKLVNFLRLNKINWNYLKINVPEWTCYLDSNEIDDFIRLEENLICITKLYDQSAFITAGNNFESFLAGLGSKTRYDIRRYLRIFENDDFEFIVHSGEKMSVLLTDLVDLNNSFWNLFKGKENLNLQFVRELIKYQDNLNNGKLIMPVLYYKKKVIAVVLGFIHRDRCFLHTAGIERKFKYSISPGITLYSLIIRYLINNSIQVLDLSPGTEEYKIRLGARLNKITQIVVFNDNYSKFLYTTGIHTKKILNFHNSMKVK